MENKESKEKTLPHNGKNSGGKHFGGGRNRQSEEIEMQNALMPLEPRPENIKNSRVKTLEELEHAFQEYRATRNEKSENGGWREWRTFIIQTACAMAAFYILLTYVIGITVVHGDSMQPSLHEQDIAVIWRLSGEYKEGDVVLFRSVGSPETLVKRVIAGPGDTVEIMDETGQVMVNDVILLESYIYAETHSRGENNQPMTLGENEYYVLGDNRQVSLDSRSAEIGAVEKGDILGKIVFFFRPGEV